MPWPSIIVPTSDLDSDSDNPLSARSDLRQAVENVNVMTGARGSPNGVASLGVDSKVPASQLPTDLALLSGAQTFTGAKTFAQQPFITNRGGVLSTSDFQTVPFGTPGYYRGPGILISRTQIVSNGGTQDFTWPAGFDSGYVYSILATPLNGFCRWYVVPINNGAGFRMVTDTVNITFSVVGIGI